MPAEPDLVIGGGRPRVPGSLAFSVSGDRMLCDTRFSVFRNRREWFTGQDDRYFLKDLAVDLLSVDSIP